MNPTDTRIKPDLAKEDMNILESISDRTDIGSGLHFSWDDKTPAANLLLFELLKDIKYKKRTEYWINDIIKQPKTPNGMLFLDQWGSARHSMNVSFILYLTGDPVAKNFAEQQLNYILGNGPIIDGSPGSLVVGHGNNYPNTPHHRASYCAYLEPDKETGEFDWKVFNSSKTPNSALLEGALIGGPKTPVDEFSNDRSDYVTNEVALDYNAGFTGLLAAILSQYND